MGSPLAPVSVLEGPAAVILLEEESLQIRLGRGAAVMRLVLADTFLERLGVGPCSGMLEDLGLIRSAEPQGPGLRVPTHVALSAHQARFLEAVWERIEAECDRPKDGSAIMLELLVGEVLLTIHRSRESVPLRSRRATGPMSIRRLMEYVSSHHEEEFSLDSLAERSGMSPTSLSRAFRRAAGVPLFEYINRTRIRKACLLLKSSDVPILEIAYAVGYNNISFFNRYFRRVMQVSPRQYRAYSRR